MDSILRIGLQKRFGGGAFIQQANSGFSHLVANEYWGLTANEGKKIAITLKNSAGASVANTEVKWAVFEFSQAVPNNADFMQLVAKGVYTTDASGNFEVNYTGNAPVGGYAYLAILHPHSSPTESVIWKVTIT